jgi:hypothetical protein
MTVQLLVSVYNSSVTIVDVSDDDIQGKESLFIIMILGSWIAIINRGSYVCKSNH